MEFAFLLSLVSGVLSMLAGGIVSSEIIQKLIRKIFDLPENTQQSYSERLADLTNKLDSASKEVDDVLQEISTVAINRQKTVEKLEQDLGHLEQKETDLKKRIEALEQTPVEAAQHFAELISDGDKRGAKRDYILFGAGVLITTIISIGLQFFAS